MEENPVTTLCMICCSSYSPNNVDELSFLRTHEQFNTFSQQVELALTTLSQSPLKSASKSNSYSTGLLLETLGSLKQTSVSICSECLEFIAVAADTKTETELIEADVLSLQFQLLTALKDFQAGMNRYSQQVYSICEILKKSDVKCLKVRMEKENGAADKQRNTRRGSKVKEQNAVMLFREAVLTIAADLGVFAEDLHRKLNVDPPGINTNTNYSRSRRCKKSSTKVKTSMRQKNVMPTAKDEAEPVIVCKIEVDMDNTNDSAINDYPEDDKNESFHHEDDNDDFDIDGDDIQHYQQDSEEEGTDSDNEYYPPPPPKPKKGKFSGGSAALDLNSTNESLSELKREDLNMKEFTKFRQRLIRRTLRKARSSKNNKKTSVDTNEVDSADSYHLKLLRDYPIVYDKESGAAKIAGTIIHIKDDLESLECSLCGYRSKPQGNSSKKETYMDRAMWNHIIGKHLKALQCPKCPKILSSLTYLRMHLKDHDTEHKRLICDVCARPMASIHSLAAHQWTHMSEAEKQESERRGIKNPNLRPEGEFQCATCGKEFKRKDAHDSHQRVHMEKQNREKTICPKCGKSLYSSSLHLYHLKYACPGNDEDGTPQRIPCGICDATFKTSVQKKKHIARMHDPAAASRPYTCDQCQKTFKTSDCLRYHRMTHRETQFFCSKGCGSSFRVKRYCVRHEKSCGIYLKREQIHTVYNTFNHAV